jgi:integrase/recombinase XerD
MNDYYIESFIEMIEAEKGASKNTIDSYSRDLNELYHFLNKRKIAIEEAETKDIRSFFEHLANFSPSPSTIARKLSSIKQFYKFLLNDGITQKNPSLIIDAPKLGKKIPKYLNEVEVDILLQFVKNDKSPEGIRLNALLETLYASGMRVTELVSLKINNLQIMLKGKQASLRNYLIIKGKGNKERIVPLNNSAIEALEEYLEVRDNFTNDKFNTWLFPSSSKEGFLTRQRFHQLLKQLATDANLDKDKVSPHVLRHSFASHLLNGGANLKVVQELLGHSDISTTQIYTHILNQRLKDIVNEHHPLNEIED